MDGEELTAQETALYDRQIRVWGVDAQKRLSKSHILVRGMNGTAVEFCKNIVLAGVGSLTLMDDRLVTEDALQANFLIPPDETNYNGRTLAELCCDSLRDFNPMVRVSVEKGDLAQFDGEFFDKFDVVVVGCCSFKTKKVINEKCRQRPKRVAFYTIECRGSCGEVFIDLQSYTYAQKKPDGAVECYLKYSSLEEAIAIPWRTLPRKLTKLYFAMRGYFLNPKYRYSATCRTISKEVRTGMKDVIKRVLTDVSEQVHAINQMEHYNAGLGSFGDVTARNAFLTTPPVIERFELSEGRNPGETSISDLPNVLKLRKDLCEAQSLNESHIPASLLERLLAAGTKEHPPVCAILGGILGQEVIKAISGKGDPLKNFFFFDTADGRGVIEDISSSPAS